MVKKRSYFDIFEGSGWPAPDDLKPYFLGPRHWEKWFASGNDSWRLSIEDVDDSAKGRSARVSVDLFIIGHPSHGVTLDYSKWDGGSQTRVTHCSKGDLTRLSEMTSSAHGTPLSLGLFVSFASAWEVVKEFIERDGELPMAIDWIPVSELPPETFPEPTDDLV